MQEYTESCLLMPFCSLVLLLALELVIILHVSK